MTALRSVCVYCGARSGADPAFLDAADRLGEALAQRSLRLVYGGGSTGMMGRLADRVLQCGGEVTGVIPEHLLRPELAHAGLTELVVTADMHQRKATMAARADAFVALPGGLGTMEELFETWTWGQLELHRKPLGLLEVNGYYAPLVTFLDHAVAQGFVAPMHRAMLHTANDAATLLDLLGS